VVPGCTSTFHLEIDHIVEFAKGGKTMLSNLCLLCRRHHAMKSQDGYRIEGRPGDWRWVPPPERGRQPAPAGADGRRARRRPAGVTG
jgi:5-methylcytosine-specific restriction endonuclease McrA